MPAQLVPPSQTPILDLETGQTNGEWQKFFAALTQQPGPIEEVNVGGSPWTFTASILGNLLIVGGTVSSVSLTRARVTVTPTAVEGFIPVAIKDEVTITWSVAPTVYFIPTWGGTQS